MSHASRRALTAGFAAAAAIAAIIAIAISTGTTAAAAEPPRIHNPATPRDGVVHIILTEDWRAGGDEDDIFFGMVTSVQQDAAGNTYVMDAQLSQVHVYDRQGRHLRTLFGEGDGPGEVRGPRDLVFMDDGRIGVVQEMPGKMIFVNADGTPAGKLGIGGPGIEHGGFCQTFTAFTGPDCLLVAGFVQSPGELPTQVVQTSFLSRFDDDGTEIATICSRNVTIDVTDFTFDERVHLATFWWNAAVAPDGLIYVAPRLDDYGIEVYDGNGVLQRTISRDFEPRTRTTAERDLLTRAVEAIYTGLPVEVKVKVSPTDPPIFYAQPGLRVQSDGSLWVLTPRGARDLPDDVAAIFDVFEPDGVFARQVVVHGPWKADSEGIFLFGDDAIVITGYAEAKLAQFSGGNMTVEDTGTAGAIEVIHCSVVR